MKHLVTQNTLQFNSNFNHLCNLVNKKEIHLHLCASFLVYSICDALSLSDLEEVLIQT